MCKVTLFLSLFSLISSCTLVTAGQGSALRPGQCKPIPGDAHWPEESQWATLNNTIQGRLLKPSPPAAACHSGRLEYNKTACDAVMKGWRDSDWHAQDPVSNMWQNWNNYSCTPTQGAGCSGEGYPIYVVAVKEAEDVAQAVKFAKETGVRLNIKSTGHCFLGRSVQPNSLSIWTRGLKHIRWFDSSFTPAGCNFAIDGPAVSVGAGSQWGEIYAAAKAKDPTLGVVGGAFGSVSVGGYISNGGHGGLSAKYGLGADMVLQIELVTAEGKIITANECQNQDYFWAMRGGGGSTYGVALAFTLQAVKIQGTGSYSGTVKGWDQIAYLHSKWPAIAAAGGGGYISGYPAAGGNVSFSISLPNATSAHLKAIVEPMVARIRQMDAEDLASTKGKADTTSHTQRSSVVGRYQDHTTWTEALNNPEIFLGSETLAVQAGGFPGMGTNKILASWLWSAIDVSHASLKEALVGAFDPETYLLNDATMGVGTQNPPYIRGGGNAVNPAFRTAVMRPAAELQWEGDNRNKLIEHEKAALKFGLALKSLNPAGGTYANEADPNFPDWQHAFWGSNYERLFSIKQQVDPTGIFYCRSCVGSELYEDRNGALCRNK